METIVIIVIIVIHSPGRGDTRATNYTQVWSEITVMPGLDHITASRQPSLITDAGPSCGWPPVNLNLPPRYRGGVGMISKSYTSHRRAIYFCNN